MFASLAAKDLLFEQHEQGDGLVNRKRRAVYPVVLQRQQLADANPSGHSLSS